MNNFVYRVRAVPEGVIIPLRPLTTQLIFTVIMAVSEIVFASAVLVLHALAECHVLKKGKALSVKSNGHRIRVINVLALLMFVGLEVLLSVYTVGTDTAVNSEQNCVRLFRRNVSGTEFDILDKWANHESIFFGCLRPGLNQTISVSGGSYSLDSGWVQCNEGTLLSYRHFAVSTEMFTGRELEQKKCDEIRCAGMFFEQGSMFSEQGSMFFSHSLNVTETFQGTVAGRRTNLSFTPSAAELEVMTDMLLTLYRMGISNEHELRRVVFSLVREQRCSMITFLRRHTVLPVWMLTLTALLCALSMVAFAAAQLGKGWVFFDMRDPAHWSRKASSPHARGGIATELDTTELDAAHLKLYGSGAQREVRVVGSAYASREEDPYAQTWTGYLAADSRYAELPRPAFVLRACECSSRTRVSSLDDVK
ncbi:hypothetical protein BWQ96_07831 [Gracilariopsis chorda]|uniref:Uncharacterized protein n=1 Tax=Gracilariopsis chorda TaxID=448386 RepID=A0A2V3IK81_9FLOR|nr:hypothetical protein BWQ96_07831 [Gracilariopsis chorda]|eukprot:PXF42453.1 hypothetical protein BWQ96_07831 [Gracilariopsis chorda]